MRYLIAVSLLALATPALAETTTLPFDVAKLCQWQLDNNSMDIAECTKMEEDSKATLAEVSAKADATRTAECTKEALAYSGDSGFASYTVYATCLKDGPGSQ